MVKIDILCYYDSNHSCLFDLFFYPSYKKYLKNNFNLIAHKINNETKESYWHSDHWSQILIDRYDIIKEYIINNKNHWCIFSDIDILFFNNFYNDIQIFLNDKIHDIYYMAESIRSLASDINGGFFLFHCSEKTYNFFNIVQQITSNMDKPNDQIAIHNFLKSKDCEIKQTILPRTSFITNNNPKNKILTILRNNSLKVFHATNTGNLMEKIQVLSSVYLKKNDTIGSGLWLPIEN